MHNQNIFFYLSEHAVGTHKNLLNEIIPLSSQNTYKNRLYTKLEDLKVLKRSPDLLNNVKIGQGQLWLIIQSYFVLPYMGSGHFDQVT